MKSIRRRFLGTCLGLGTLIANALFPLGGCLLSGGCMSDGHGWVVSGGTGDWHFGYKNLEKIPGRNYTFRQTFDAEGMAIMTSAIKNLQSDAAVVCNEATGVCTISAKKDMTHDQWMELLRTIPHNPEAQVAEEATVGGGP